MITACPECKTRFRAAPEQLAIRQGLVKCGSCGHVFNGFAHAQKETDRQPQDASAATTPSTTDLSTLTGKIETPSPLWAPITASDNNITNSIVNEPGAAISDKLHGHINDFPQNVSWTQKTNIDGENDADVPTNVEGKEPTLIIDETFATIEHKSEMDVPVDVTQVQEKENNSGFVGATNKHQTLDLPNDDSPLWEYQPSINFAPKKNKKALFILWLLIIGLAIQTVYIWRTEIITYFPQTKLSFDTICHSLGCRLPLFRQIDSMDIEASNMETDEKRANVILVNAVLRNRSDLLLAYPLIEITLTDNFDRAIARRSLDASEYAPKSAKEGFAPDSELVTHMAIETSTLKPSGYRLRLYYR